MPRLGSAGSGRTVHRQRAEVLAERRLTSRMPIGRTHAEVLSDYRSLQRDQGPCLDCYHSGAPVSAADLRAAVARWPLFVEAATEAGFASVHAVPLRLRDNVLGTMGLFGAHVGALADDDLDLGQALAYVAAVAIVQDKVIADKAAVNEQLQVALNSRVLLEQAKGVLSQRGNLDMDRSFAVLRRYARDHDLRLTDVARGSRPVRRLRSKCSATRSPGEAEPRPPPRPEPLQVARG